MKQKKHGLKIKETKTKYMELKKEEREALNLKSKFFQLPGSNFNRKNK